MKTIRLQLLIVAFLTIGLNTLQAQTANKKDRALWGSIAVPPGSGAINLGDYRDANNKVLLTWRMLPGDTEDTAFNLWRKTDDSDTWTCVNDALKTGTKGIKGTNYQHAPLSTITGDIHYRLTYADPTKTGDAMTCDDYIGEYTMKMEQATKKVPYVSIKLQSTDDCSDYPSVFTYEANDCSVGDLDGDGQLEIVVKRLLNGGTPDNSDTDPRAKHVIVWDAYKLDGTMLWRVKSGPNIIVGNSSSVMLGDLDGDGCAEFVLKTGEGTVFGDGKEIGDTDGDGITDYRKNWDSHYTGDHDGKYGGPEYFSVVDGKTGREMARGNFIARGPEGQTPAQWVANSAANSLSWGDGYWKRANSLRMGLAQFTGRGMQIFLGRGVYARTVVEGWDYKPGTPDGQWQLEGSLTRLWKFDSSVSGGHWSNVNGEWKKDRAKNKDGKTNSAYAGQGNHAFNVADLDGDGLDEVMYGSCAFDNDGTGLWSTGLGHGDANHVGVFQKGFAGLQVYHCLEGGVTEVALHDAKTGAVIWDVRAATAGDQGRCMVADVDPTSPGCEFWKYGNELFDQNGQPLMNSAGTDRAKESSCNAGIWFDGYLNRQMINEHIINSYSHGRTFTMYRYEGEAVFNNGTKSNPGWYGDMLGDWREEVICPDATKTDHINIFSTWYPTEHRIPWLMTDHTYYMQAIHENVGYNQPTNVGYFLGSDYTSDAEIWAAAAKAEANRLAALEQTLANQNNEQGVVEPDAVVYERGYETAWTSTDVADGEWMGTNTTVDSESHILVMSETGQNGTRVVTRALELAENAIITLEAQICFGGGGSYNNNGTFKFGDNFEITSAPRNQSTEVKLNGEQAKSFTLSAVDELLTIHLVVNTLDNSITALSVAGSDTTYLSLADIDEDLRRFASGTDFASLTLQAVRAGSGGASVTIKKVKVQQEVQSVSSIYTYTVNYKEGGNIVKTVTGSGTEGTPIPVLKVFNGEGVYAGQRFLTVGDVPSWTISTTEANNVKSVTVRKLYATTLNVYRVLDGVKEADPFVTKQLKETDDKVANWVYTFPRCVKIGDVWYEATLKDGKYGEEGTFTDDALEKTVEYSSDAAIVGFWDESHNGTIDNLDYSGGSMNTYWKETNIGSLEAGIYEMTAMQIGNYGSMLYSGFVSADEKGTLLAEFGNNRRTQTFELTEPADGIRLYSPTNGRMDYVLMRYVGPSTGISDVRSKTDNVKSCLYDLQGRKIGSAEAKKGLYIMQGKKLIVK